MFVAGCCAKLARWAPKNTFGVDHKKDKNGKPIEQGVGRANNMSRQCITAYVAEQTTRRPGGPEAGYAPGRSVRAHRYSIGMLMRKDVFSHFAGLNPGIRAAAAIYKNGWSQPAAEGE
jgi:hypothetical protein